MVLMVIMTFESVFAAVVRVARDLCVCVRVGEPKQESDPPVCFLFVFVFVHVFVHLNTDLARILNLVFLFWVIGGGLYRDPPVCFLFVFAYVCFFMRL